MRASTTRSLSTRALVLPLAGGSEAALRKTQAGQARNALSTNRDVLDSIVFSGAVDRGLEKPDRTEADRPMRTICTCTS